MEVQELDGGTQRVSVTKEDLESLKALNPDGTPKTPEGTQATADIPQRPAHVPEKFWNAEKGEADYEALAKSYAELEQKLAQGKPADVPPGDQPPADPAPAANVFADLSTKATKELEEGGALTEETLAGFEKIGLSREQIETYIEGQKALGLLQTAKVYQEVGGEAEYGKMIEWAKSALSADEIKAYDDAVLGRSEAAMLNAVRGLKARYAAEFGRPGAPSTAAPAGATSGARFESKAELVAAMRDPRYAKDSAYRAEVARKIEASERSGVYLGM